MKGLISAVDRIRRTVDRIIRWQINGSDTDEIWLRLAFIWCQPASVRPALGTERKQKYSLRADTHSNWWRHFSALSSPLSVRAYCQKIKNQFNNLQLDVVVNAQNHKFSRKIYLTLYLFFVIILFCFCFRCHCARIHNNFDCIICNAFRLPFSFCCQALQRGLMHQAENFDLRANISKWIAKTIWIYYIAFL